MAGWGWSPMSWIPKRKKPEPPPKKVAFDDRFDELLKDKADKYGLPWLLVKSVTWQESRFNPGAVSSANAMGLMQLMPRTAKVLGVTDPFDPEQNVKGGCKMLASLYATFKEEHGLERYRFAVSSYNVGIAYVLAAQGIAKRANMPTDRWPILACLLQRTRVKGKTPYWQENVEYVHRIFDRWTQYCLLDMSGRKVRNITEVGQ